MDYMDAHIRDEDEAKKIPSHIRARTADYNKNGKETETTTTFKYQVTHTHT